MTHMSSRKHSSTKTSKDRYEPTIILLKHGTYLRREFLMTSKKPLGFPLKSGDDLRDPALQSRGNGLRDNCSRPVRKSNNCDPENTEIHQVTHGVWVLS